MLSSAGLASALEADAGTQYAAFADSLAGSNRLIIVDLNNAAMTLGTPTHATAPASSGSVSSAVVTKAVDLADTPVADDVWTVSVAGTGHPYAAHSGDSVAAVAAVLAGLVHGDTDYAAKAEGSVIVVTHLLNSTFTLSFWVSPASAQVNGPVPNRLGPDPAVQCGSGDRQRGSLDPDRGRAELLDDGTGRTS